MLLEPGDCLVYRPSSLVGLWIAVKTWTWASHVEVVSEYQTAFAARISGVHEYALDLRDVGYVLRPRTGDPTFGKYDAKKAREWFETVRGQKYDLLGLLVFYLAVRKGSRDRMFCSELATRLYRHAGFFPFPNDVDADRIAPAQFLQTLAFDRVWKDNLR